MVSLLCSVSLRLGEVLPWYPRTPSVTRNSDYTGYLKKYYYLRRQVKQKFALLVRYIELAIELVKSIE